MADRPVLVTVTSACEPPGQLLTVRYPAVHVPGCPSGGGLVLGEGLGDGLGDVFGDVVVVLGSCEKNFQISPPVQVRAPLVEVDPSTGSGVWSPSNATHS